VLRKKSSKTILPPWTGVVASGIKWLINILNMIGCFDDWRLNIHETFKSEVKRSCDI